MLMTLRICVTLLFLICPCLVKAGQHKLASSSIDSTYHSIGVALEAATSLYLTPSTDITLISISTAGARENVEFLSSGQADFAIMPSLLGHHARTGTGPLVELGPRNEIRAVAMIVPTYYHALINTSGLQSGTIDDLFAIPEKRLRFGTSASEAADVTEFLFEHLGTPVDGFDPLLAGKTPAKDAFLNNEIDALVTTGNLPMAEVEELMASANGAISLLGITEGQLALANEGYDLFAPATIPAGTYPNQPTAIETLALPVFLATRADVDEEVVYQIVKLMFEQINVLRTIHPAMASLDFETAIDNLPVPLHPGAARYYRDYGLSIAETTTIAPDYPVFTLGADNPEQRRLETNSGVIGIMVDPDATSLQAASELALMINSPPSDVRVVVQRGEGSGKTVNDLLYLKGVDLGIVQADVLEHLRRQEETAWLPRQLHYLAKLYDREVHILVRDDVQGIQDLAGRRVNFGPDGSASEVTGANIFSHLGIGVERLSDPSEIALDKLRQGEIDAVLITGGKPLSVLESIEPESGLKFLDIPPIGNRHAYKRARMTATDYPSLVAEGSEIRTLSVPAVLMTYKWPRDSDRYQLLSAFFTTFEERLSRLQQLQGFHPKWQGVSLTNAFEGWPRSSIATNGARTEPSLPAEPTRSIVPLEEPAEPASG